MLSREQFKSALKERAFAAYEKRAAKVVDYIGKNVEQDMPAFSQQMHNWAGPTSPLPPRTRPRRTTS